MKFVHIADVHFDMPFTTLETNGLGEERRLKQRDAFKRVIDYVRENNVQYLFICGDLYEQEYIRKSTIEYINNQFETIPKTKIFIVPGNHDPYIKNSYYKTYRFPSNVKIFTSNIEKIEDENIEIYGYGFEDFYMNSEQIENLYIQNKEKINILLTHCDLDGSENSEIKYNPILKSKLKNLGFNYIALGHIHKPLYEDEIVYPGSLISLGFDELGKHGMIVGEINDVTKELYLEFITIDESKFIEIEIDVTDIASLEDLVEKINQTSFPSNKYIKIILVGKRNVEIEELKILKYLANPNIIKIKNKSELKVDLEELSKQNNLRGIFVKNLLKKMQEEPENKDKIEKAIEIGLSSFN